MAPRVAASSTRGAPPLADVVVTETGADGLLMIPSRIGPRAVRSLLMPFKAAVTEALEAAAACVLESAFRPAVRNARETAPGGTPAGTAAGAEIVSAPERTLELAMLVELACTKLTSTAPDRKPPVPESTSAGAMKFAVVEVALNTGTATGIPVADVSSTDIAELVGSNPVPVTVTRL